MPPSARKKKITSSLFHSSDLPLPFFPLFFSPPPASSPSSSSTSCRSVFFFNDTATTEIYTLSLHDALPICNRGKIQATIDNARAMRSASPSLAALAKSYEITRKRAPRSIADLPTSTPQAEAFAKQLKSQRYRFIGPTSVYAFMQNVGVVNDHIHGCFRATDYPATASSH